MESYLFAWFSSRQCQSSQLATQRGGVSPSRWRSLRSICYFGAFVMSQKRHSYTQMTALSSEEASDSIDVASFVTVARTTGYRP